MRFLKSFLLFFSLSLAVGVRAGIIDESSSIFLPPTLKNFTETTQNFSFFWKALLLIENSPESRKYLFKICDLLKNDKETISEYYCTPNNFKFNEALLKEWIQDAPLRQKIVSSADFQKMASSQLAAASLPGAPRELLSLMRQDPMGEAFKLWGIRQGIFSFPSQVDGYFSNEENTVLAIPLSFVHAPQNLEKTQNFIHRINSTCDNGCPRFAIIGPHTALMNNQNQILEDLKFVSILGASLFALTMFLVGWQRGLALLSLCVPLSIAIALALLVTVLVTGSVHGLTLAFGPSLVGLVLDYGVHTKIHRGNRSAWSSNLFGLLTTLSGFIALAFSEIPLLRQLMLFSIVGLVSAFALYYFFSQTKFKFWTNTEFKLINFDLKAKKWSGFFSLILLLAAFLSFPFLKLDLNLKNFEYRQVFQSQLENQMWSSGRPPEIFFKLHSMGDLNSLEDEKSFAKKEGISYQSWSSYVPSLRVQEANLSSWKSNACKNIEPKDSFIKKFYEPFYSLKICESTLRGVKNPPVYASDFISRSGAELLSVWVPKGTPELESLKKEMPAAISLRSVFESFPTLLLRELALMFPIGLLMCVALIFYHTRKLSLSLLALVPMFSALGLIFLVFILLGKSFSFVSCVALLMIFGSSVDYGIFKVDSLREKSTKEGEIRVFNSLLMNALLTFVGYLPLVFAKHPVLNDLGWVLSLGTIGAFLGGIWGVTFISQLINVEDSCEKNCCC